MMREIVSTIIWPFIFFSKKKIIILTYHRIDDIENDCLTIKPKNFKKQMHYLHKNHYNVITLSNAYKSIKENKIKKKSVVITFDDGFEDNYTKAYPILKKFNFPAIIFLIAGKIGKTLQYSNREAKALSFGKIKKMQDLIDFGSHTLTHPLLTKLSKEELIREVNESKKILENDLGSKIDFFCYPKGDFNNNVKKIVSGYYSVGCSVISGMNNSKTDLFELKRIEISPRDNIFDFQKKLAGAYVPMHRLLYFLKKWKKLMF